MFWKTKNNPKDLKSTAMVRQDPRTNVKTATAQSETTNTTVQNSTIVNSNTSRITFQTTRQTVTHRQQARVTEIVTRRTPTPEELEEMMRQVNLSKTTEAAGSSGGGVASRRKANNLPAIASSSSASSIGGISSKSTPKFKSTPSPLSRTTFTYDSPKIKTGSIFSDGVGGASGGIPKTPTLVKIEQTTVTTKNGRKVTSHTEQQRIKFDSMDFKTPAPFTNFPFNQSTTANIRMIDAKPVPAIAAPPAKVSALLTTRLPPPPPLPTTFPPSLSYTSPYLNRTIYSTPTTVAASTPTFSSSINVKTTTKPPTNSIFKKTASSSTTTTTTTPTFSLFANELKTKPITKTTPFTTTTSKDAKSFKSSVPSNTINTSSSAILRPTNIITKKKKSTLKPGCVYIFNNETFDKKENEFRTGSSYDVNALRRTFEYYKLDVKIIHNATLAQIHSTVNKIQTKDYSKHSCIAIVILSHGTRSEEVAAKDGNYSIDDTIVFPMLRNHTLNEKPKIFVIQACKGSMEAGKIYKDATQPIGSPNEILKCYSTFEGFAAYRQDDGSIFIQAFCESLKKFGNTKDIKEIVEDVMKTVKQQTQNKQIPSITSTLTIPYIFGDYV